MTADPSSQALFSPFTFGTLTLNNRIVMAPMTRGFSPDGIPGEDVVAYYRRRAGHGVGLIVTEGTIVNHPEANQQPGLQVPHFYGEAALAGWKRVVNEVHEAGGRIIPQLWHMGTSRGVTDLPASEIEAIISAFGQAAADAKDTGFDGIELHGAHGYLIDQFFWEQTNQRTDEYGGDLVSRTRFAVRVIEACRRAVGPDFPIVLRISQWKSSDYNAKLARTPEELEQFLAPLAEAGADIFHCSTRRFWQPEFEGSDLNLAGWVKKLSGKPTITVGSVGLDNEVTSFFTEGKGSESAPDRLEQLAQQLEDGEFDLVAVGRALLSDPEWAAKVRDGRWDELVPFSREAAGVLY